MKTIKKMCFISFVLFASCSSNDQNQQLDKLTDSLTNVISGIPMSVDSLTMVISELISFKTDSEKIAYVNRLEKKVKVQKMSNEEYFEQFNIFYKAIHLKKLFGQAPLYGKYANELAKVLAEMDEANRLYNIFEDKKLKQLYDKIDKDNKVALENYTKYGEPDEDLIYINSACKAALPNVLKDPDFEIIKDKYYLKQTSTGYKYKLLIRSKNSFGANVQQEITFNLKYNSLDKLYEVVDIK
jgi:hypothetical protein